MEHHQSGNCISTSMGEKGEDLYNAKQCSVHGPVNTIDGLLLKHMGVNITKDPIIDATYKKPNLNTHTGLKK